VYHFFILAAKMWTPIKLETHNLQEIPDKATYSNINRRCSRAPAHYFDFSSVNRKRKFSYQIKKRLKGLPKQLKICFKSNLCKIPRLIVATASITYCLYQILMIAMMYLQYKTKVSVYVSEPELIHMPGITVCTNTR